MDSHWCWYVIVHTNGLSLVLICNSTHQCTLIGVGIGKSFYNVVVYRCNSHPCSHLSNLSVGFLTLPHISVSENLHRTFNSITSETELLAPPTDFWMVWWCPFSTFPWSPFEDIRGMYAVVRGNRIGLASPLLMTCSTRFVLPGSLLMTSENSCFISKSSSSCELTFSAVYT